MAGELADLVFTDLPYNVDYKRIYCRRRTHDPRRRLHEFASSSKNSLKDSFHSYRSIVKPSAVSMYVCHSSSWQREFQNAIEEAGFAVRCQLVWAKNVFAWGFGRYKFQHEPIFYCHVEGEKDPWFGDKSQSTLWEENKPAANRLHPTMKPIALITRALHNSIKRGDTIVDFFGEQLTDLDWLGAPGPQGAPHGNRPQICGLHCRAVPGAHGQRKPLRSKATGAATRRYWAKRTPLDSGLNPEAPPMIAAVPIPIYVIPPISPGSRGHSK